MNFKFQVSQETMLDSRVLIDRIFATLKKEQYAVNGIINNKIKFQRGWWVIGGYNKFKRIDNGEIDILPSESKNTLLLTYSIFELIPITSIVFGLIIWGLITKNYVTFISLILLFQLIRRIIILKRVSKELLKAVAVEDEFIIF